MRSIVPGRGSNRECKSALARSRGERENGKVTVVTRVQPPETPLLPFMAIGVNVLREVHSSARHREVRERPATRFSKPCSYQGHYSTNQSVTNIANALSRSKPVQAGQRLDDGDSSGCNLSRLPRTQSRLRDSQMHNDLSSRWGKKSMRLLSANGRPSHRRRGQTSDVAKNNYVPPIKDSTTSQKIATFRAALKRILGHRPLYRKENCAPDSAYNNSIARQRQHCALSIVSLTLDNK